jgi:hypothetical protein
MNRTVEGLQAKYVARFLLTALAVIGAAVSTHLIWLGKTGNYLLPAIGTAIVCICAGWIGTRDLHRRWMQLRQFRLMQEHGPYDRREYVPPREAGGPPRVRASAICISTVRGS